MDWFRNHPLLELRRPEVREELTAALAALDAELPLRAGALDRWQEASAGEEASLHRSVRARPGGRPPGWAGRPMPRSRRWTSRSLPAGRRARSRSARRPSSAPPISLAERRHRLTALIVREVGKPWEDADAEVCEAIDFLRFYALGARAIWPRSSSRRPASATSSGCGLAARRR